MYYALRLPWAYGECNIFLVFLKCTFGFGRRTVDESWLFFFMGACFRRGTILHRTVGESCWCFTRAGLCRRNIWVLVGLFRVLALSLNLRRILEVYCKCLAVDLEPLTKSSWFYAYWFPTKNHLHGWLFFLNGCWRIVVDLLRVLVSGAVSMTSCACLLLA